MLKSLAQQFIGWLDRVVDADERVVCAICDERFAGFDQGRAHVRMAHPHQVPLSWRMAPASSAPTPPFTQPAYALRTS